MTITYQGWDIKIGEYFVYNYDQTTEYSKRSIWDSSDTAPKTDSVTLALEAGNYVVKVAGYYDHTGNYKLKGSYKPSNNNEKEPNNYFESSMSLQNNQLVTGFFSESDRLDFYKFNITSPATVELTLTSRVHNMDFSIWDKDHIEVATKDCWYASEDAPKTETLEAYLEPGTYYIRCEPDWVYTGRYQLKWTSKQYVSSITMKNATVALNKGKSVNNLASVNPGNANNKTLTWSSSNTSVATVTAAGTIKACGTGYATITATSTDGSNVSASCTVIVKPSKASITKLSRYVYWGKTYGRKITVNLKYQSGVSGYQVMYSTDKKFKKKNKSYLTSYTYTTTKQLAKSKKYYFRVRAYYRYNDINYYGPWSNVKSIKTKKK